MTQRPRLEVLQEINAILASEGLPVWENLKRIGKYREGEFEITGVSHVIRDLKQYFIIIIFDVIKPDGSTGQYGMRISHRIPTCVVAIINGQVLFVQQHRLSGGRWMIELPRGWIEHALADAVPGGAAQALLEREIGTEWIRDLLGLTLVHLGSVWEDTGTHMDQVEMYLIEASSKTDPPKHRDFVNPKLYSWDRVHSMIDAAVLNDQATLTALYKAERFLTARLKAGTRG